MSRMARQAIVLSVARVANYGLMFISPLILVRLLPIAEYGGYREYLAYVTVLIGIATFSIHESMLYFIPMHTAQRWRVVRNTVQLVALSSVTVVVLMVAVDLLAGGRVVGKYLLPLSIYVLLHVNLDFWEWYWISDHRPLPVFVYTSGRLLARMAVVISAALLTRRVDVIIYCLIGLEALRFTGSFIAWRRRAAGAEAVDVGHLMREQWRFCLSAGTAILVATLSRNVGNIAVVKVLGVVPLALYSTGLYGEPIIVAVRNSISSILLPEMVRRGAQSPQEAIVLWRSASVINCLLLMPAAMLLLHFAAPLVRLVFGATYAPAATVLQIYTLIIVRDCFDLTLPLRASRVTAPLVRSSLIGLLVNSLLLLLLLRPLGIRGAVLAMAVSGLVEGCYQAWSVKRITGIDARAVMPWGGAFKVLVAAVLAGTVLYGQLWASLPGIAGMLLATIAYVAVYAVMLHLLRVRELSLLRQWVRHRRVVAVSDE